jgi:hypothetical protein
LDTQWLARANPRPFEIDQKEIYLAFSGIKYETIPSREAGDRFLVCHHWYLNGLSKTQKNERMGSVWQSNIDFE